MSYFGLHLQTPVTGWIDQVRRAADSGKPYRIVKSFWIEAGTTVKSISPKTITVFRHNVEHKDPFLNNAILSESRADDEADNFILQFKDSVNRHGNLDFVESLNETYASYDVEGQRKAVAFDRAFIRRLKVHCPNTKPVVYTAASGNIGHDEYSILIPLAQECAQAGGAFGYHNYWSVVNGHSYVNSPSHARDYHMRWDESLDTYLVNRGIRVKYVLGESGPIGAGPNGYWQRPNDGWIHPEVWNHNFAGYINDLIAIDNLFLNTLAHKEGRLMGATLFTSGEPYVGWEFFQIRDYALDQLTNYVIGSDIPNPPDPPEPPNTTFEERAWAATTEMQKKGQNGIRLNSLAAIQRQISDDNNRFNEDFQIVTSEIVLDGAAVQAAESLSGRFGRRVWVWEAGKEMYYFEDPFTISLLWPVKNEFHHINSQFNEERAYGKHEGIDLYARLGDPIVACLDGTVIWASNKRRSGGDSDYGSHIIIDHGNGLLTWYCHLDDMISAIGDVVRRGDQIGTAGSTGNSTGVHLHLNLQMKGYGLSGYVVSDVIDPEDYLIQVI